MIMDTQKISQEAKQLVKEWKEEQSRSVSQSTQNINTLLYLAYSRFKKGHIYGGVS